ncbi:telomere repeat-binding protein 3-like protein [Tanacetum coccineum]
MSDSNSVAAVQEKNSEKEEEQEQEEKRAKNRSSSSSLRFSCCWKLEVMGRLLKEQPKRSSFECSVSRKPKRAELADTVVKCQEPQVKVKHVDEGSCAESESMPECISIKLNLNSPPKDLPDNDSGLVAVEKETEELTIRDSCLDPCVPTKSLSSSVDIPNLVSCFTRHMGYVKSGIKDDDDNSSRFHNRGTKLKAIRSKSLCVKYRRIRKMLASTYHKVTSAKYYELSNPTSAGVKPLYKRARCQVVASNQVKFRISSFKVPEVYFEVPVTATIGSLKRVVMDAVNRNLSGELRVGVLFEGKKVRDNNRTLQQMGISHNCDLGTLKFTLEHGNLEASPSPIKQEPPLR